MRLYCYQCPSGHKLEEYREVDDRNTPATCGECGKPAERDRCTEILEGALECTPDVEHHFNLSMMCEVKGREHLRRLQRDRGMSDYDPKEHGGPPSDWS